MLPLLPIQKGDWAETLHLSLLGETVPHLTPSQLTGQEFWWWEIVRAVGSQKVIGTVQEQLQSRGQVQLVKQTKLTCPKNEEMSLTSKCSLPHVL